VQQAPEPPDFREYGIGPLLVILVSIAVVFWVASGAFVDPLTLGLGAACAPLGIATAMTKGSSQASKVLGLVALGCFIAGFGRSVAVFHGQVLGGFAVMACFGAGAIAARLIALALRRG
jgi:hypothetical protein